MRACQGRASSRIDKVSAHYRADGVDGQLEMERNKATAKHVAWPSCAWLLLSFFPYPVGHPEHEHCMGTTPLLIGQMGSRSKDEKRRVSCIHKQKTTFCLPSYLPASLPSLFHFLGRITRSLPPSIDFEKLLCERRRIFQSQWVR